MKRFFILAAVIAVLAACTKTTVYDDTRNEIGISPVAGQVTKANGPIKDNTYPQDLSFGIFAYHKITTESQSWADFYGAEAPELYIDNGEFIYKSTYWGGNPDPYYWPKTGYLAFAGYSPFDLTKTSVSYTNAEKPGITIEGFQQGEYVWATNAGAVTNSTVDLMWFDADDQNTANSGPMAVKFRHALSWLDFNVKTDATASGKFKILKITLTNVCTKGNFNSNTGADSNQDEWSELSESRDIVLYDNETGTNINETAQPFGDLLIIPQSIALTASVKNESKIIVEYQQLTSAGTPLKETYTGTLTATGSWELGKHYTYNLTFTLNEILINPSVDNWTDATGGDITIQ